MKNISKNSVINVITELEYLPNRTPEMSFSGAADKAFAELSKYRDGAIYVGHYSGDSEWERHSAGEELVMALVGSTTLVLLIEGKEEKFQLNTSELMVVPRNTWHRFEQSKDLKIMTVTPQPTDHSLERPVY